MSKDKKFRELKDPQKKAIDRWLTEQTKLFFQKNYVYPDSEGAAQIAGRVQERAAAEKIPISYNAILRRYNKKHKDIIKRARREMDLHEDRRTETVTFTNMCMVIDACGNVAALDKKSGGYVGTTFPGGHLEEGETFHDAVIREVREETGLEIFDPLLCGVYHWTKDGVHNVIFLYRAEKFSGEMKSSDEGDVYWIPLEQYRKKELAGGMGQVLQIVADFKARECWMHLEDGRYREYLF